jgi:hypothetical protein
LGEKAHRHTHQSIKKINHAYAAVDMKKDPIEISIESEIHMPSAPNPHLKVHLEIYSYSGPPYSDSYSG